MTQVAHVAELQCIVLYKEMQLLYRICCHKYYPSEEKASTAFADTNHDTVHGFSSCKIHEGSGESSSAFNRPLQKSDDPGLV